MDEQHNEHLKDFFLDLARPRADTDEARAAAPARWNAWRCAPENADVFVTFAGVDFREAATSAISFAGFEFGRAARFDGATFGDEALFRGTLFQGLTNFSGSSVGSWKARERARRFGPEAERDDATKRADSDWRARQKARNLGPHAFQILDFAEARILGTISFAQRSFERPANFTGTQFHKPPVFDGATNLQRIDFTDARFRFAAPEHPHWEDNSRVLVRLRAFRAVAEQTKNHDLERDLYIEERKVEQGVHRLRLREAFSDEGNGVRKIALLGPLVVHWCWRRVMDGYWLFSDYGRSLVCPPIWLVVTLPLFVVAFDASLAGKRREAAASAFVAAGAEGAKASKRDYFAATRQLAIANTIPFVGALSIDGEVKKFLLCGAPPGDEKAAKACVPIAPWRYQLALIVQNAFSALMLFFFGLALRNYFKVK